MCVVLCLCVVPVFVLCFKLNLTQKHAASIDVRLHTYTLFRLLSRPQMPEQELRQTTVFCASLPPEVRLAFAGDA